ncbi:hypothetical protein ACP0FZ_29025, partial [Escherichia coli]
FMKLHGKGSAQKKDELIQRFSLDPKKKAKNKTTVAKPQLKETKREGSENGTGHYGVHRVVTLRGGGVDQ